MTDLNNLPPLGEWRAQPPPPPEPYLAANLVERLVLYGVCVFGLGLFVGVLAAAALLRLGGA